MKKEKEATFGLLLNGLDFLASALDHLRGDPSARDMKYGVLHLSAGVALVLKEPLRRHDPKLLFENPADFDQTAYQEGEFKSVRIEECIKRLKKIGVSVPHPARAAMKALKPDRNRLEHFGAKIAVAELSAVTAAVLSFAVDFVHKHLGQVTPEEADLIEEIREGLPEFEALVQARMNDIADVLEQATIVRPCPRCAQDALMIGDGDVECAFCRREFSPQDAAEEYLGSLGYSEYDAVTRGGDWPLYTCPACEMDEVLVKEDERYLCFYCGAEKGHLFSCMKCGGLYEDEDQGTVCAGCFAATVASDD